MKRDWIRCNVETGPGISRIPGPRIKLNRKCGAQAVVRGLRGPGQAAVLAIKEQGLKCRDHDCSGWGWAPLGTGSGRAAVWSGEELLLLRPLWVYLWEGEGSQGEAWLNLTYDSTTCSVLINLSPPRNIYVFHCFLPSLHLRQENGSNYALEKP